MKIANQAALGRSVAVAQMRSTRLRATRSVMSGRVIVQGAVGSRARFCVVSFEKFEWRIRLLSKILTPV